MKITYPKKIKVTVKIDEVKRGQCIQCATSAGVYMRTGGSTFVRLDDASLFDESTLKGHGGWVQVEVEVVVHG